METEEFKVGDVVTLRSEGCRMTVEKVEENEVSCVWFEVSTLHYQSFDKKVIKKVIKKLTK